MTDTEDKTEFGRVEESNENNDFNEKQTSNTKTKTDAQSHTSKFRVRREEGSHSLGSQWEGCPDAEDSGSAYSTVCIMHGVLTLLLMKKWNKHEEAELGDLVRWCTWTKVENRLWRWDIFRAHWINTHTSFIYRYTANPCIYTCIV